MTRCERFAFLCNAIERQAIANLAVRLQRSQSDALRFVVTEAARQLVQTDANPIDTAPGDDSNQEQERTHAAD